MVATNTAQKDNPKLNVRDWSGNQPTRIVIDRNLRLNKELHIFDGTQKTIVITEKKERGINNVEYVQLPFNEQFYENLFNVLYKKEIQSIIIEGGAKFLQNLINNSYWDEARQFVGNVNFFNGIKAPTIEKLPSKRETISNSYLLTYYNLQKI